MKFFDQTLDAIQAKQQSVQRALAAMDALVQQAQKAQVASQELNNYIANGYSDTGASAGTFNAAEAAGAWLNAVANWRAAQNQVALLMAQNADVTDIASAQAQADAAAGPAQEAAAAYATAAVGASGSQTVLTSPIAGQAVQIANGAVNSTVASQSVATGIAQLPMNAAPAQLSAQAVQAVQDATKATAQAAASISHALGDGPSSAVANAAHNTANAATSLRGGFSGKTVAIGLAALLAVSLLRR